MTAPTHRRLARALLVSLACVPFVAWSAGPDGHAHHRAQASVAAADPFAPVYVVTSGKTYDAGLATLAPRARRVAGASGEPLVVVELRQHQLEDLSRHVHETEHRCGGYFAFASREEADAFLRDDRTAIGIGAKFLPDYTVDSVSMVERWLPKVSEPRLRATISHLSTAYPNRHASTSSGRAAALWIRDSWQEMTAGREDVSVELFTDCGNCMGQPSVIFTIRGNERADEIVVLGAHLDSISSVGSGEGMVAPGADDDASGIATLTEVLRIAMNSRYRPQRTIQFMAYAAEEVGLRGSRAIAQRYQAEGRDVVGVLQMDMTNYRSPQSTTDVRVMTDNSNVHQVAFMRALFAQYLAPSGYTLGSSSCGYACSDHASWTQAGFPAGMYDEGPFFPQLHTPNDRLANQGGTAEHATIIARLGLAFMGEMGKQTRVPGKLTPWLPDDAAPGNGDMPRRRPQP